MRKVLSFLVLALLSCVTHQTGSSPEVVRDGWAWIKGEVMIYDTKEAMIAKDQSRCISAVSTKLSLQQLVTFDGKKIRIVGTLLPYSSLADEDAVVLRRKILDGIVVSNFCLKNDVILIRTISLQ
jgi:hypothetical protein